MSSAIEIEPDGSNKEDHGHHNHGSFFTLALGSLGVVFGDIGTSPFYAFREALSHTQGLGNLDTKVVGIISLIIWSLVLVVTVKYVLFLMRADNKGEGGTLALMALAQKAVGKFSYLIFLGGVIGAAFFYGDGIITPAISVLGAIEGLKQAPVIGEFLTPYIMLISIVILIALFVMQSHGTEKIAALFGPITAIWFFSLAGLGIMHIMDDKSFLILNSLNPLCAASFLIENGFLSLIVLGSVFLAVTGAEALYADMGHFGKGPIRAAWFYLVFPSLALNYMGQGAFVISHPEAAKDPFWMMVPDFAYWPIMILAALAAIIASQAVISGAYSITQQAVQLGLLPRMQIKHTSASLAGQIYVPQINTMLLAGVLVLVLAFKNSDALTSAYGMAITGTMLMSSLLAIPVVKLGWKWKTPWVVAVFTPLLALDIIFIGAQVLKIPHGAWLPLIMGAALVIVMWTWSKGSRLISEKTRRDSIPLKSLLDNLLKHPIHKVSGTAIFLTADPELAPVALMHNIKHNKVIHENIIIASVVTSESPRVADANRVRISDIAPGVRRIIINYGFMESPNIPKALSLCRKMGVKFDIMATSFFIGHRTIVASENSEMPLWQDHLFISLSRNAINATDFFHIPSGRVVELGTQVMV